MPDYNGLTRNQWPGTWSPSSNHPIVLDTEIRGGLRYVSGNSGDRLSDITGQRLQDGMVVYVENGYTEGSVTYQSGQYYKFNVLPGESRDASTGVLPNDSDNWEFFKPDLTGFVYDSSSGLITITTSDGSTFTDSINLNAFSTSNLSEGTNLYFTTARADSDAKNAISLTFTGGDGAASYTPATGVISVTGPSASEVRAHLTANKGLSVTSGEFNIDSSNVRGMFSGGTGITYNSGTGEFTTTDADIVHDNLSGFVANEHINHTSVSVIAGKGLAGGGTIAADRTIDIDSANVRGMFSGSNGISYSAGTGDIRAAQPLDSAANPTFNQLRGPATFVIDPATIGDATGTVQILGNLQVDGTTTTINSTDVTIDDKTFTLADNAADSSELNSGGIIWGGSSIVDKPSFTYNHASARFDANRTINATSFIGNVTGTLQTAAQPNITSVGDLDALTVTGEIDARGGITDNGGSLILQASSGNGVRLRNHSGNDLVAVTNAGVAKLNYTSSTKLETTDSGVLVTGQLVADSATFTNATFTGDVAFDSANGLLFDVSEKELKFGDNYKATFGDGGDLQIYHDGSTSIISDQGTGQLRFLTNQLRVKNTADNETIINALQNGAVELYYDNSERFRTTDSGVLVTGQLVADSATLTKLTVSGISAKGVFGSFAETNFPDPNDRPLILVDSNATMLIHRIHPVHDASVELKVSDSPEADLDVYWDFFAKKADKSFVFRDRLASPSHERLIITHSDSNAQVKLGDSSDLFIPDKGKILLGDSNDLQIYHDGANSYIADEGTGNLNIKSTFANIFGAGGTSATFYPGNAVTLYYNNTERLRTTDSGATVIGSLIADSATISGDVSATTFTGSGASLTNVDAETLDGINSTSFLRSDAADAKTSGDLTFNDDVKAFFGTGSDLEIFHSSAINRIQATGLLYIKGTDINFYKTGTSELMASFQEDSSVSLYYDAVKKFETTDSGVLVTGKITSSDSALFDGNGSSGGVSISDGLIDIRTGTGNVSKIKFYCEAANAHFQTLQAAPHSAGSSAVIVLPTASGTLLNEDGSGASLTNLNASNLGSGTVPSARLSLSASDIPNLTTSKITSGVFDSARIPSLSTSDIVTGTFDSARLPVIDATRLGGLQSSSFLRSDQNDSMNGILTITGQLIADSADLAKLTITGGAGALDFTSTAVTDVLRLGNNTISQVQKLSFNDPGVNEGLEWTGGNTKIYESPNNLTNAAGNLQFIFNDTRRMTVDTYGAEIVGRLDVDSATISGGSIFFDSAGNSGRLQLTTQTSQSSDLLKIQTDDGSISIGAANTTYAHVLTDRSLIYIEKIVEFGSNEIRSYNNDFQIKRDASDTHKIVISDSDVQIHNGVLHIHRDTAPSDTVDKLYNVGGSLFWNGTDVTGGGSGGAVDSSTTISIIGDTVNNAYVDALNVNAATVTATANNSTDETVYLTFVDGATGEQGIETDTGLTYNPSSGLITLGDASTAGITEANYYQTRDVTHAGKFRYWSSATDYVSGFVNGYTYGGLGDGVDGYAINWTMNNTTGRGFIWDQSTHSQAQGAMALTANGKLTVAHSIRVGYGEDDTTTPGATHALDVNGSFAATTKSFVIDHPTKEGMKLRYGSLEGPENGVYVRGRLKDNNTIELPDYWTGLVDEDTITVNLTAIGKHQEVYVEDIADNKVIIGGEDINCFYTVYGERKDVDQLVVEYDA